ncbi:MAG: hypothetical protein AAGH68_13185 [Pseudomonadota bacterium]
MIVLAFVACLQSSPDVCREQNLLFSEQMSPMTCLMQAQPRLAEWSNTHPGWRVASWRCGSSEQFGTKV